MNSSLPTVFRWMAGVITAVAALPGSAAKAQDLGTVDGQPGIARRKEISQSIIEAVREAQLERAFTAFEAVGDGSSGLVIDEDLSSAAACLHRALSQLDSEAQFELLSKWTIPGGSPPKIRTFTAVVPNTVPPIEFARVLGERPRGQSFPVSSMGEIKGVFCTGWALVVAARDSGRLKKLMTELAPLADKQVSNAELLMALALIADGRGDMSKIASQLSQRTTAINESLHARRQAPAGPANAAAPAPIDPANVVLAAAALQHPTLRSVGEELFGALLAATQDQPAPGVRAFLRRAAATAKVLNPSGSTEKPIASALTPPLKYWVPVSSPVPGSISSAAVESVWMTLESQILNLSGSGNDALMLRFPLVGDFQFECETPFEGGAKGNGGLIYGGLGFQPEPGSKDVRIVDAGGEVLEKRACPFFPKIPTKTFNRLSMTSATDSVVMAMNLHPMWTDKSGFQTSPWVGLRSFDEYRPQFRNLKLTGQPVIPRSVNLVDAKILRGWSSHVYGERIETANAAKDWQIVDGELRGVKPATVVSEKHLQYLLAYQRPLLDGESISYEFFYQQGASGVSPALGRVAFLIQPDGVRIHWVTDGDRDWTGLEADNAVTEPLHRRGPRRLSLKANAWNRVRLSRSNGSIKLSLDDTLIYERPIDWSGDQQFGFYRVGAGAGTDAQIRQVVMTGDWPQTVPRQFLEDPTAVSGEPMSVAQTGRLGRLFHQDFFTQNVTAIRRSARAMPPAERFEFLSQWILPEASHADIRMSGEFTPTRPSPPAFEVGVEHPERGGQVVSPVFDWLDTAEELGRLDECRQRVEALVTTNDRFATRARAVLLLLIGLQQKNPTANAAVWESLFALIKDQAPVEGENHWPELLLAARCGDRFPEDEMYAELISDVALERMPRWRQPDFARWHNHLASCYGPVLVRRKDGSAAPATTSVFNEWIPVTAARAYTNGSGHPNVQWSRRGDKVVKISCHETDYLFYRIPLSGDFDVETNLVLPNQNPVAIMIAGSFVGPIWGIDRLDTGTFRTNPPPVLLERAVTNLGKPVRYRAEVRDGIVNSYLNGKKVHVTPTPQVDPWIAIRSPGRHLGTVTDLRITGRPKVLDSVPMSVAQDLTGWTNYHEESWWQFVDKPDASRGYDFSGWILGHKNSAFAGSSTENLLRYQRPLIEDGSIEYEFFYEPGVAEVHPALDRLAFILYPSGIREHWITDGQYDRTDVSPTNLADVVANRRGPAQLPLNLRAWNRLSLTFRHSAVAIQLNGTLVYERDLEPFNQRVFGLFHYADFTEARVRNVVMRGDWPKVLPPAAEQEFADKFTESIDAGLPRLGSVFTHSFENEGLPGQYFEFPLPNPMEVTPDGILAVQSSDKDGVIWDINPRFSLSGDFDIEAAFAQLSVETRTQYCGIFLRATLDAPQKPAYELQRLMTLPAQQISHVAQSFSEPKTPGVSLWRGEAIGCEADSGRLRLARRGKRLSYLVAEGNSETFHLFGSEEIPLSDSVRHGVRLQTFAVGGTTKVIWKNITLRAERMTWFPVLPDSNLLLKIVQADGTGMRTIVTPGTIGFTNVGSPEWSADGRKIVMDVSKGSTATSHIFVANADGSDLKDLGMGCMPSFSADGGRIAFSEPGQGVITMKSDGTDRQVIDRSAWGVQWSPDGKWIAYSKAGNITVLNVETRQSTQLLMGENATRYGYIYWNLAWSHDSRGVGFKARRRTTNRDELAFAEFNSRNGFTVIQEDATTSHPDISFSPDSQQMIVSIGVAPGQGRTVHAFNIKEPGSPTVVDVIPANQIVDGISWSHDGKSIAIAVEQVAEPTEWVTGMKFSTSWK